MLAVPCSFYDEYKKRGGFIETTSCDIVKLKMQCIFFNGLLLNTGRQRPY